MARATIEERVAALEQQLAELKRNLPLSSSTKDWRQAIGLFPHNELMKQIDAAGQAIREADRRRARRRQAKRQRTKR